MCAIALLLVAWAALIVYASWFPLSGWRWPVGGSPWTLLLLPWPRGHNTFDIASNLLPPIIPGAEKFDTYPSPNSAGDAATLLTSRCEVSQK